MNTYSTDKAVTIRYPSTANLMVDSEDRPLSNLSPFNFQIYKPQSIMNGFFTRVGTTEVVLEWCEENINSTLGNNIIVDISGVSPNTHQDQHIITLNAGTYTIAQALDAIVLQLNDLSGTTGTIFAISTLNPNGGTYLTATGGLFYLTETALANRLGIANTDNPGPGFYAPNALIDCGDLRPYRYIDFVCPDLTYNQEVKDNSTQAKQTDVLCRWYFSYDEQNILDKYGFPILMGYTQFVTRRLFNPPKQIKWDSNIPLGSLSFQVLNEDGEIVPVSSFDSNWLMTLQFSEN